MCRWVRSVSAILAWSWASAVALPPGYTITDLGMTDSSGVFVWRINNRGQVPLVQSNQSYIWKGGQLTPASFPAGLNNSSPSINDLGHVAGSVGQVPFIWSGGAAQDLPMLSTRLTFAHGVNDADVVVGESFDGLLKYWPVYWQNGSIHQLPILGDAGGAAYAISNAGGIVGAIGQVAFSNRAVVWEGGQIRQLPFLDGYDTASTARDINEFGQVVGYCNNGVWVETNQAVLWIGDTVIPLGSLPGRPYSEAHAINDAGQIVGLSREGTQTDYGLAFIWEDGRMYNLNDLIPPDSGWILMQGHGINNQGQIVGMGLKEGYYHSFVLTPVPEPAGVMGGAVAGAILLIRRRRAHGVQAG